MSLSPNTPQSLTPLLQHLQTLLSHAKSTQSRYFIGICGAPSSGKSTLAEFLQDRYNDEIRCLPMDGFHLYKKDLDSSMMLRRGAHFTFDSQKLYEKLREVKGWQKEGSFPSFEHGVGDPVENDIRVERHHNIVIVEGLYMAYSNGDYWKRIQDEIFDETWFIDVPIDEALERLKARHMKTWGLSEAEALRKIERNDEINAKLVMTTKPNATYLVMSKSMEDWYLRENPLRKTFGEEQDQLHTQESHSTK